MASGVCPPPRELLCCRAIARFEEGVPELDTVTKVILGGPEGSFDLLFPLTRQTQYYASVFVLPEVRLTCWEFCCMQKIVCILVDDYRTTSALSMAGSASIASSRHTLINSLQRNMLMVPLE